MNELYVSELTILKMTTITFNLRSIILLFLFTIGTLIPLTSANVRQQQLQQNPWQPPLPTANNHNAEIQKFIKAISKKNKNNNNNMKTTNSKQVEKPKPEFTISESFQNQGLGGVYNGIISFGHLPWTNCFSNISDNTFDIAITGMPFDLGVSYRPGARFGPSAARVASRRISPDFAWE